MDLFAFVESVLKKKGVVKKGQISMMKIVMLICAVIIVITVLSIMAIRRNLL
ncbi:hypothetical protein HYV83_05045 [Candidatus Woesearchaeota archaeon]|nr:hypothetical protein [Candidatus Woesearchaeota archaeon]